MQRDTIEFFDGKGKEETVQPEQAGTSELNDCIKIWNRSGKATSQFNPDTDKAWNCIKAQISANTVSKKWSLTPVYWAAASLLFFVAAYLLYSSAISIDGSKRLVVEANSGKVRKYELIDGSTVWVNSGSLISYDEENPRHITLEGEGYFKVSPDPNSPFVVEAGGIQTTVLGTEFNVSAQEEKVTVDVVTGEVKVDALDRTAFATANTRVEVLKKENTLVKSSVSNYNFLFWKTGVLEFQNTPLVTVLETLSQYYQTELYSSEVVQNCSLTVKFDHNTLEESMDILATLLDGAVEKRGVAYHLNGSSCQ